MAASAARVDATVIFGSRTVPALRIEGEKISGSRSIMRRLEQLAPEPPLFPADVEARARVEEAERWGDEIFQQVARRLAWVGIKHTPAAMVSYSEHSRLRLPPPAIRLTAPTIARLEARLDHATDGVACFDLQALPAQL